MEAGTTRYGENPNNWITTENKNMTLVSISAFFLMLKAQTKDEFVKYYKIAAHDNNGATIWYWIEKFGHQYDSELYQKSKGNKHKKHWYTNGTVNLMAVECPIGFHAGVTGNFRNQFGECGNK